VAAGPSRWQDAPVSRRAWIAFAACSVLWGVPYYLIKIAVEDVSPAFVSWSRIALGAAVLLPVAWRAGAFRGVRARWRAILAFSVVELCVPFTLIPVGEQWISSSLAAILTASVPLIVAVMAMRWDPSERPTGARLAGLFVGLAGVVALVGVDVAGRPRELLGAACLLLAAVGYAGGPMLIRTRMADLHPMGPVATALLVSAVLLAPAGLATAPHEVPAAGVVGAIAGLGVACTAVALATMFFLVAEAGPSRATIITYVIPVIAVGLGVALLGEDLGAASVAGLLLILAGSWMATGGRPPGGRLRPLAFRRRADGLPRPSPS
jgi:drug/metabolite transporter (DMT)-like permease